jgi:hypothetical protein
MDATESVRAIRMKPTEAVESIPIATEVETSETAEVDTAKSVESTKMEATEMASPEVTTTTEVTAPEMTTAEMATTGIRDFGQCDHSRDERCCDQRDKLIIHDTLLLDGDLLVATEVLRKWRSCGFFGRIYRSRSIAAPTSTASAARWCRR